MQAYQDCYHEICLWSFQFSYPRNEILKTLEEFSNWCQRLKLMRLKADEANKQDAIIN